MNRGRWYAMLFLVAALVAMLVIGFYLGATHQEARPVDSGPATSGATAQ